MLLSEEDMFSCVAEIAFEVYWRRFWTAPSVAATDEMLLMAPLRRLTAGVRPRLNTAPPLAAWAQSNPVVPSPVEPSMLANDTVRVSPAAEPTWKVTPVPAAPALPSSRLMPLNSTEPC